MTLNQYQDAAGATVQYKGGGTFQGVVYNALKLAGEAGEIADKIGKMMGKGVEPTSEQVLDLQKELGDVLWHTAQLAFDLGIKLEDVGKMNLAKLQDRLERNVIYGDGDNR